MEGTISLAEDVECLRLLVGVSLSLLTVYAGLFAARHPNSRSTHRKVDDPVLDSSTITSRPHNGRRLSFTSLPDPSREGSYGLISHQPVLLACLTVAELPLLLDVGIGGAGEAGFAADREVHSSMLEDIEWRSS